MEPLLSFFGSSSLTRSVEGISPRLPRRNQVFCRFGEVLSSLPAVLIVPKSSSSSSSSKLRVRVFRLCPVLNRLFLATSYSSFHSSSPRRIRASISSFELWDLDLLHLFRTIN